MDSLFCIFHVLSFELNFFRLEVPFKNTMTMGVKFFIKSHCTSKDTILKQF